MVGYICDAFFSHPDFGANDELEIIYKVIGDEKANVVAVVKDYRSSSHFLETFKINDDIINSLQKFQPSVDILFKDGKITNKHQSVDDKLKELWNRSRHNSFTRNFVRYELFLSNEFVFCSPWRLKFFNVSIPAVLEVVLIF